MEPDLLKVQSETLVMLFPCIFPCCIREGQLVIIIFYTFFTNNILILLPNLLGYMKQSNVIFITEFVIQGLFLSVNTLALA